MNGSEGNTVRKFIARGKGAKTSRYLYWDDDFGGSYEWTNEIEDAAIFDGASVALNSAKMSSGVDKPSLESIEILEVEYRPAQIAIIGRAQGNG